MKKRVLLLGLVVAACGLLALVGYLFRSSFRKPAAYTQMASLFPAQPLAYMQCAQLASRLQDFSQRPLYQALLQSPLFDQIQETAWWQEFSSSWQDALQGMIIDPLRIIGTDTAIGVYQTKEGELAPGVLVITKIDSMVTLAERLLYLIESVSGTLGIQKQGDIDGIPVYRLQHEEMIVPVYYSIIGDLGIISTSFPLLQHTLLQASGKSAAPDPDHTSKTSFDTPGNPFRSIVAASKRERFVTMYWDVSKILHELQQYELFDPQEFFDESLLASLAALPFFQVAVEVSAHSLVFSFELFSSSVSPEKIRPFQESDHEKTFSTLIQHTPQQYPLLATVKRTHLESLFSTLEQLFHEQSWQEALLWHKQQSLIWGELVECRLAAGLFGTVYTIPNLACLLDTRHPQRARAVLEYSLNLLFDHLFPSAMQRRTMASTVNESYRDATISSSRVLFQEVFAYAIYPPSSQTAYTALATNTQAVKSYLDTLREHPEQPPFTPMPWVFFADAPSQTSTAAIPIGGILIRTTSLLELLEALSKTSTFALLFPQKVYPGLYEIIPVLRQSDAALPDEILLSIHVQDAANLSIRLFFRTS